MSARGGQAAERCVSQPKHVNVHVPTELIEMILLAAGEDWHFVLSMVCRRWRDILAAWRRRGDRRAVLRTPQASMTTYTIQLAIWARLNGCPWNETTCALMARSGHLEMLQMARCVGCPWNERTCAFAAQNGHLAVLQWARAYGCSWDVNTCNYAAESGHLAVVQWARTNGCPWNEWVGTYAAENGHLAVLQWARANGC